MATIDAVGLMFCTNNLLQSTMMSNESDNKPALSHQSSTILTSSNNTCILDSSFRAFSSNASRSIAPVLHGLRGHLRLLDSIMFRVCHPAKRDSKAFLLYPAARLDIEGSWYGGLPIQLPTDLSYSPCRSNPRIQCGSSERG